MDCLLHIPVSNSDFSSKFVIVNGMMAVLLFTYLVIHICYILKSSQSALDDNEMARRTLDGHPDKPAGFYGQLT